MTVKLGKTIADGALSGTLGELTFPIIKQNVSSIFTATDEQLIESLKFLGERMKILVEPTGCLGLAGLKNCGLDLKGKKIGVIISGGNVDLTRYAELIK